MTDIDQIAAQYPIGAQVRYYPVLPPLAGTKPYDLHLIKSTPWALGHGAIIIKITGFPVGVSVNHIVLDDGSGAPVDMPPGDAR